MILSELRDPSQLADIPLACVNLRPALDIRYLGHRLANSLRSWQITWMNRFSYIKIKFYSVIAQVMFPCDLSEFASRAEPYVNCLEQYARVFHLKKLMSWRGKAQSLIFNSHKNNNWVLICLISVHVFLLMKVTIMKKIAEKNFPGRFCTEDSEHLWL